MMAKVFPSYVQPKLDNCEKFTAVLGEDLGVPFMVTGSDVYFLLPDIWGKPLENIFRDFPEVALEGYIIPNTNKIYITKLICDKRSVEESNKLLKVLSSIETTEDFLFLKSVKCNTIEEQEAAIQDCKDNGFSNYEVTETEYRIAR